MDFDAVYKQQCAQFTANVRELNRELKEARTEIASQRDVVAMADPRDGKDIAYALGCTITAPDIRKLFSDNASLVASVLYKSCESPAFVEEFPATTHPVFLMGLLCAACEKLEKRA